VTRLQDVDCEFGQGFHFAKPLYGHEIMAMAEAADPSAPARQAASQGPAKS
jgi:EAL domain-containing protein (putative c-di-GMP-specific phosphodiesterase class I)